MITSAECQHAQKTNEAPHSDWHCWLTWKWFVIIQFVSYLYNTRNNTSVTLGVNDCTETKLGSSGCLKHQMNRSSRRVRWKGIIFIVGINNFFEHAKRFSLMHIEFYNYICHTVLVVTLCGLFNLCQHAEFAFHFTICNSYLHIYCQHIWIPSRYRDFVECIHPPQGMEIHRLPLGTSPYGPTWQWSWQSSSQEKWFTWGTVIIRTSSQGCSRLGQPCVLICPGTSSFATQKFPFVQVRG